MLPPTIANNQGALMEGLDFWRLCDEFSVVQAALLIVDEDPAGTQDYIDGWEPHRRPSGYEAAFAALSSSILSSRLPANLQLSDVTEFGEGGTPDWRRTTVKLEDLKAWLAGRGIRPMFFFPDATDGPEYLDSNHPNYAPKLAAAVGAWGAVSADPELLRGKSVKQALLIWLRRNADHYSLTKDDGSPNEQGIEEVAKIANWDTKGGAPKTPGA
jgi:hypothetical protein